MSKMVWWLNAAIEKFTEKGSQIGMKGPTKASHKEVLDFELMLEWQETVMVVQKEKGIPGSAKEHERLGHHSELGGIWCNCPQGRNPPCIAHATRPDLLSMEVSVVSI